MTECKHLWVQINEEIDKYYCQKCLRQIRVERWKDVVNIFDLDKNRKFVKSTKGVKEND